MCVVDITRIKMKKLNIYSAPFFKNKMYFVALVLFSLFSFCIFNPSYSYAAPLSIGTAPVSEILNLQPGDKYHGEIVVWNLSNTTTTYDVLVTGFRQIENQPGTAIFLSKEEEAKNLYSAASWITVDRKEVELVPNRNEKIYYDIVVPKDATKGEYNVIIAFLSQSGNGGSLGTATLTTLNSGTPILIKVGKDFVENAELLSFTTDKNFYEFPNVIFTTRIKNLGDTHISPIGEIILTNMFDKEIARIPFNENTQSIMRENTGNYESTWDFGKFLTNDKQIVLGPIDAKLVATYRTFQPGFAPLTADTSFWILPWRYIVAVLLIIALLVIIVKTAKKKKAEYKPLPK